MVSLEKLKAMRDKLLADADASSFYGNWGKSHLHVQCCRRAAARLQVRIEKMEGVA